ncbi:hypothetical protein GCM10022254_33320 [Actinomadura meridiana]|uniref:Guanylate cyclase domain-containing protein n=1 Tax=Actinomadura meridiana TaxID=559626 RepID=A0ABP8C311_9ACTN
MSYRTVMAVDLQGYGSTPQNVQHVLQANLVDCLREAATNARLDADRWEDQGSGDGKLMVLPHGVAVEALAGRFVRDLNGALRARNRLASVEARTRMRLAIHHGPVAEAPNGYTGSAPVVVTRLVNADPLRRALHAAGTDLAVIVSAFVFRGSIEAGMTSLDPTELRHVHVPGLGADSDAWFWLPNGPDPRTLDLGDDPSADTEAGGDAGGDAAGDDGPAPEPPPSSGGNGGAYGANGVHINAPGGTVILRDQNNTHYYGDRS